MFIELLHHSSRVYITTNTLLYSCHTREEEERIYRQGQHYKIESHKEEKRREVKCNGHNRYTILGNLYQKIKSNSSMFINVALVRDTRIPVIRLIHSQSDIEIDITLNNLLVCIFCNFYH